MRTTTSAPSTPFRTNTTSTTRIVAAIAAGAGLLLAACSDDEAEALTKPEFVEQANEICQATSEQLEPIFESVWAGIEEIDTDDPANEFFVFERWRDALTEVVPIVDQELTDIRALTPPPEDAELIAELLDDQEAAIDEFTTLMSAAADGDRAAMATLERDDPFEDLDRRAREYGLTVCGQSE